MSSSQGMQGPDRPTVGSRFSHGYQFPRTDHSSFARGDVLRIERLGDGAYAQIVVLEGDRGRRMFDVCGSWTTRGADGNRCVISSSSIELDELAATSTLVQLVRTILREREEAADAVA